VLQANRDSARRSKIRKKEENENMVIKVQELEQDRAALACRMSAARERVSQLKALNLELRQQLEELGIHIP
jgi:hypothetical protein